MEFLKDVLRRLKPGPGEVKSMKAFVKKLLGVAGEICSVYGARPMLCGSVAKGTWIKPEVDLFLLFPASLPEEKLEDYGLRAGKEIIKEIGGRYHISYSEHPYVRGVVRFGERSYSLDVVPCYDLPPGKVKSSVDRTPHHARFVIERIKGLEDEVRLLKAFCEAAGCYGAEPRVGGFSGYLCELLVIKYGKFLSVVENASSWKPGTVITLTGPPVKKFRSPLVFVDPVDPKRNVAAAVSETGFFKFVKACNLFLSDPSERFFYPEPPVPYTMFDVKKAVKSRGTRMYIIRFPRPEGQEDAVYLQMKKCVSRLKRILEREGFELVGAEFWLGPECAIFLEAGRWQLPAVKTVVGPSIYSGHAGEFLTGSGAERFVVRDGKWVGEYRRDRRLLMDYLTWIFSKPAGELVRLGIPKKVAEAIAAGCEVTSGSDAVRTVSKLPPEFGSFLREYFERDLNPVVK